MNLKEEVKDGTVLVDFYADWCGPCKMMGPVLEHFKSEYPDVKIVKVNIDQEENLAREYGVMSIPTIYLFKDGEVVNKNVGFTPKEILGSWLN